MLQTSELESLLLISVSSQRLGGKGSLDLLARDTIVQPRQNVVVNKLKQ
jgi:hypothetical protein